MAYPKLNLRKQKKRNIKRGFSNLPLGMQSSSDTEHNSRYYQEFAKRNFKRYHKLDTLIIPRDILIYDTTCSERLKEKHRVQSDNDGFYYVFDKLLRLEVHCDMTEDLQELLQSNFEDAIKLTKAKTYYIYANESPFLHFEHQGVFHEQTLRSREMLFMTESIRNGRHVVIPNELMRRTYGDMCT